jgi:3-isopropylmalate/(R)-2-methylmalate dehydratase small subunit
MEKFTTHTGVGVPLRRSNVDTDQIIPAVYLKRVTRTGFEDALFAAWRGDPDFVLNQEEYRSGSVLVAGPDFGTGSSREHAVWALKDYGFKVVLSTRFADIFRGNSGKQGLVAGQITAEDAEMMFKILENEPGTAITVDLVERTATAGDVTIPFQIDDYTRWRLMEGLDDIGLTLQKEEDIVTYESTRADWRPKTLPAKTLGAGTVTSARPVSDEAALSQARTGPTHDGGANLERFAPPSCTVRPRRAVSALTAQGWGQTYSCPRVRHRPVPGEKRGAEAHERRADDQRHVDRRGRPTPLRRDHGPRSEEPRLESDGGRPAGRDAVGTAERSRHP